MDKIEPTYVIFEQAKWLKEKGFDVPTKAFYDLYNNPNNKELSYSVPDNWNDYKSYSAPEQWQVVEWLRLNHGIWVSVSVEDDKWFYGVKKIFNQYDVISNVIPYKSPQEAYSAAFDYIFNNLI